LEENWSYSLWIYISVIIVYVSQSGDPGALSISNTWELVASQILRAFLRLTELETLKVRPDELFKQAFQVILMHFLCKSENHGLRS
jgi:hypothetical protein